MKSIVFMFLLNIFLVASADGLLVEYKATKDTNADLIIVDNKGKEVLKIAHKYSEKVIRGDGDYTVWEIASKTFLLSPLGKYYLVMDLKRENAMADYDPNYHGNIALFESKDTLCWKKDLNDLLKKVSDNIGISVSDNGTVAIKSTLYPPDSESDILVYDSTGKKIFFAKGLNSSGIELTSNGKYLEYLTKNSYKIQDIYTGKYWEIKRDGKKSSDEEILSCVFTKENAVRTEKWIENTKEPYALYSFYTLEGVFIRSIKLKKLLKAVER